MSDTDDLATLMQQIQSAALPEGASASSTPTSSTGLLPNGKKTKGRVKIKMEYISNKLRRYTTFSKRKTGIMKKALELSTLTGTQVMLLVASETGHVYTYATSKLQPIITSEPGKSLIDACLKNQDDGAPPCKTEFTCDSQNGNNPLMRKRKMTEDPGSSSSQSISFPQFLPTMVASSLFTPFNEDDYNNDDSGADDSDSEEAASDIIRDDDDAALAAAAAAAETSPSMVMAAALAAAAAASAAADAASKKEASDDSDTTKLHKTLKEALRAAANNRQQQQKRAKLETTKPTNPASKASFVAPFLLQGLTATSTNNGTVFNLPQGTVFTSTANDSNGGANASAIFNAAVKAGDDATVPSSTSSNNPLFNFPINFQQLMESAALGVQITNAE